MNKDQAKKTREIGVFIKKLRKLKGISQVQFAQQLGITINAVSEMEKFGKDFSTQELLNIGEVLGHQIIKLRNEERDDYLINGGKKLSGSITTNTSKNGAMGLISASLLNKGITTLHGIPRIQEVFRYIEILESIGVCVEWKKKNTLIITPPEKFSFENLNIKSAKKIRSFLMSIGALCHHLKSFVIPTAGGCKMGERTISAHKHGLEALGLKITTKNTGYHVKSSNLKPAEIVMYEASDTATENILIAAAGIPGKTTIHFAQKNYMVQDVCLLLEKMGVKIKEEDGYAVTIQGKKNINKNIEYHNSEDPVESMMFISAALVTRSKLTIKRCPYNFLKLELLKLHKMGVIMKLSKKYVSKNKRNILVDITISPSHNLVALNDKIHATPYPGINTDNLPFFVPVAIMAKGNTLVHDWMWEDRAIYFTQLNHLGASIRLADQHRVLIRGGSKLVPGEIICPPALRPSTMILVTMLGIKGTSTLRNVYSINRGYENIVERLNSIGADIEIIQEF